MWEDAAMVTRLWDRLWDWLEHHLPDLTAVFDDDPTTDPDHPQE